MNTFQPFENTMRPGGISLLQLYSKPFPLGPQRSTKMQRIFSFTQAQGSGQVGLVEWTKLFNSFSWFCFCSSVGATPYFYDDIS